MKFKKILLAAFVGISTFTLAACSSSSNSNTLEKIKEKGTLVVATSPDYAPFEFQTLVDGENEVVGSDMSMAQDIADALGVELEIITMSFDNVLSAVQSGKADIAISGLSVTSEREKVFDFSDAYYTSGTKVLVQSSKVDTYTTAESLAGLDVAAQKGTIQEDLAKEQLSSATLVSLGGLGEAINELKSGVVQAVIVDSAVAEGYAAQNSDLAVSSIDIEVSDGESNAIAMPKGSDDLKEAINKVIAELKANGTYDTYLVNASQLTVSE